MQRHALSTSRRAALGAQGLDPDEVEAVIDRSLDEDLRDGPDATSEATIDATSRSRARLVARSSGTVAGLQVAIATFERVGGPELTSELFVTDGTAIEAGTELATVSGPTRAILLAERTALNLLCHLSGVATETAQYARALAGTPARVRDTRKTTPGLRALEKFAVRCGGGVNHRLSLGDALLIKDNHVAAAGGVGEAIRRARLTAPELPIEVEVDTLDQLSAALDAGAELLLLDNMDIDLTKRAVAIARTHGEQTGRPVLLESSGRMSLDAARDAALGGVDYISVGSITHSAPVLDIGLDFEDATA